MTRGFWAMPAVGEIGRRHPVGIYGMFLSIISFISLLAVSRYMKKKQNRQAGIIGWSALLVLGLCEFLLANTRADLIYLLPGFSLEETGALIIVAISIGVLYCLGNGQKALSNIKNSLISKLKFKNKI